MRNQVLSLLFFAIPVFARSEKHHNQGYFVAPRVMDYLRMPHQTKFNMAIIKEFPIHEQVKIAFRAELYGALNHVYFGTNGNNFSIYQNLDYTKYMNPPVTAANIAPAYADIGANIGGNRTIQLGLKLYF